MNHPTIGWLCNTLHTSVPSLPLDTELPFSSIDSRTLTPGSLFWAVQGTRDGHEFVASAFERGAACVVVEARKLSDLDSALHSRAIVVEDTSRALRDAAAEWRTSLRTPLVAITGSNGKTTTKDFLLHFLKAKYKTAGTAGNLNNELGVPLTLLGMGADCGALVIEMGAAKEGDIRYLCDIANPDHGLVTSIGAAHLQGFKSLDGVARTKGELYDFIAESGIGFVPVDDALCVERASKVRRKVGFGFEHAADDWRGDFIRGENLEFDRNGCASFRVDGAAMKLNLPGKPMASAALAALTVATTLGVELRECAELVSDAPVTGGRANVFHFGNLTVLDDSYNANPVSMKAALETLRLMPGARKVAILGDMGELGEFSRREHESLGYALAQNSLYHVFLVGDQSRFAAESARVAGLSVTHFAKFEEIEPLLSSIAAQCDTLLVKASRSVGLDRVITKLKELIR